VGHWHNWIGGGQLTASEIHLLGSPVVEEEHATDDFDESNSPSMINLLSPSLRLVGGGDSNPRGQPKSVGA
jgi:hypothetical protein